MRNPPKRSIVLSALVACVVALVTLVLPASPAGAWAPAATATIHPGVMTFTAGAQCTANFVFTQGSDVYIGQAAHCSGTGAATDTNGCDSGLAARSAPRSRSTGPASPARSSTTRGSPCSPWVRPTRMRARTTTSP